MFRFNTERFEIARHKANLSNKKVCEKVGITPGTLCTWKNGKNIPSSENLTKLAEVLGINTSDLLLVIENEDMHGESIQGATHGAGKDKLRSTLLYAAASVMAVREELIHEKNLEIEEEQISELLSDTELYFSKLWKIIEMQVK